MGTENKARRLWLEVEVDPEAEGVHDELRHLANALADYDHVMGVSFGEETVGFGDGETIALQGVTLETNSTASQRLREWARSGSIGHGPGAVYLNDRDVVVMQAAADGLDALDEPDDEPEYRWGGESLLGTWTCRLGDREVGSVLIQGDGRFSAGKQVGSLRHEYGCFDTLDHAKAAVEKAARGVTP